MGRSVVGARLGPALAGLAHAMREFRSTTAPGNSQDEHRDLLAYMDHQGYLDLAHHPSHATAALFLSETLRLRTLYIRAFTHCVGMSDVLPSCPEHACLTRTTRRLLSRARDDLTARVSAAHASLSDLLDDAMSESRLGIPPAARAHLHAFRVFLATHYASRLGGGSYPPPGGFDPHTCRLMARDLDCLYRLLVDTSYATCQGMPPVASNGVCVLQLVAMFDREHRLPPLAHPLPHMPRYAETVPESRYSLRWPRPSRSGSSSSGRGSSSSSRSRHQRLLAHAALIKASNWRDRHLADNPLVRAYQLFEDESVARPAPRKPAVSVADARKVRWILVYALHQVLRSVTTAPPEAWDADQTDYHTAVDTDQLDLPPWHEAPPVEHDDTMAVDDTAGPSVYWAGQSDRQPPGLGSIEIKPDIDYFALTHREPSPGMSDSTDAPPAPTRQGSMSRALRRNSTVRRSMRLFRPSSTLLQPATASPDLSHPASPSYARSAHSEILVEGYGNGLNSVTLGPWASTHDDDDVPPVPAVTPVRKTARNNSRGGASSPGSTQSDDTLESSIGSLSMTPDTPEPDAAMHTFYSLDSSSSSSKPARTMSGLLTPTRRASMAAGANALRRPVSTMLSRGPGSRRFSASSGKAQTEHSFDPLIVEEQAQQAFEDDWMAMQAFMDGETSGAHGLRGDGDVKPAWEQYNDLGGLTETRC